tara:strand:- start:55 stop:456 length:402 start_codon:yes stop_codon:yes gene_type:complete
MLNGRILGYDAGGRVKNLPVASFPAPYFNGGTPASTLQELVTTTVAPVVYRNALGYDNAGAVCIDTVGAIASYVNGGLPVTAAGRLAVSVNAAVTRGFNGLPFDAAGRLALATAGSLVNLHAFTSAFNQGAFS